MIFRFFFALFFINTLSFYGSYAFAVPVWQCLKPEHKVQYPVQDFYDSLFQIKSRIGEGDSLGTKLLRYQGIYKAELYTLLHRSKNKKILQLLKKNTAITTYLSKDTCQFIEARIHLPRNRELRIFKENNLLVDRLHQLPVEYRTIYKEFTINNSLFVDGNEAGLSDRVLSNMESLLAGKVNFSKAITRGDIFRVLYEYIYTPEGEFLRSGHILFIEYQRKNGKVHQVGRYSTRQNKQCYLDSKRRNLEALFIRNPLKYTRISSDFAPKRLHPVLNVIRDHNGVDLAAPKGTPVRSVADGLVIKKYHSKSYGKVVFVRHGKRYTTVYAHFSRFAKNLKKGSRVTRNQIIGYVGKTGLATGYHLHYEFRIDNKPYNPMTVSLPYSQVSAKCHVSKKDYQQQLSLLKTKIDELEQQSEIATK